MHQTVLLDPVRILMGAGEQLIEQGAALMEDNRIVAFGDEARKRAVQQAMSVVAAPRQLLAPCLVDPHSILEEPFQAHGENLRSLCQAAAHAGFGQIALLPTATAWRDRTERLQGFSATGDVHIHLWGALSLEGQGQELSCHSDLIDQGAVGLSDGEAMPSMGLLQRSLVLAETGKAPVLVAPRDPKLQGDGMVREGVETLRAGWPMDPVASETIPFSQLLELQRLFPDQRLWAMNLSTAAAVEQLSQATDRPDASVHWWHLVMDRGRLAPTATGWCITPSLGGANDRQALIDALKQGLIAGVAVHAVPLDTEDCLLPPGQRKPGLAGHRLVLPLLWRALVVDQGWSEQELWQAISYGPSQLLQCREERLSLGSNRWLLYDPDHRWTPSLDDDDPSQAANQPLLMQEITGAVVACGLRSPETLTG